MTTELTPLLKQLKLGARADTLTEPIALARREQLDYASFLEIILSPGDHPLRRGQPTGPPARGTATQGRRIPADSRRPAGWRTSAGGLRLEDFDWRTAGWMPSSPWSS